MEFNEDWTPIIMYNFQGLEMIWVNQLVTLIEEKHFSNVSMDLGKGSPVFHVYVYNLHNLHYITQLPAGTYETLRWNAVSLLISLEYSTHPSHLSSNSHYNK